MHYWLSVPVCMLFDVLLFGCVYDYIVCVVVVVFVCMSRWLLLCVRAYA